MSQPKETLNFRIGLSGTFWEKAPLFSILLDGHSYINDFAGSPSTKVWEFDASLDEGQHLLEIRLENKTDKDTVQNEDKTEILKDLLLNIDFIEIDNIPLDELMWSKSEFIGDNPSKPILKRCVNLGWNGSYRLEFTSPFYLWLLENM